MMIRSFKITDNKRRDFGIVYDGFYLQDGSGDIQVLTPRGTEILYTWEFSIVLP